MYVLTFLVLIEYTQEVCGKECVAWGFAEGEKREKHRKEVLVIIRTGRKKRGKRRVC